LKEAISQETVSDSSHSCIPEGNESNSPSNSLKSAAMLGLALSVGASGVLVSQTEASAAVSTPTTSATTEAFSSDSTVSAAAAEASAVQSQNPSQVVAFHTVESGESLWQIAQQHRVGLRDLKEANALPTETAIRVGQVLKVPGSIEATAPATSEMIASITADVAAVAPQSTASNSTASNSDSEISQQSTGQVIAQSIENPTESPAESIRVADASQSNAAPVVTALATPSTLRQYYQVQSGDTLSKIASSLGTTSEDLIRANSLANPNVILTGDILRVPAARSANVQANAQANVQPSAVQASPVNKSPQASTVASTSQLSGSERLGHLRSTAVRPEAARMLDDLRSASPEEPASVGGEQVTENDLLSSTTASRESIDPYVANLLSEVREIRSQSVRTSEVAATERNSAEDAVESDAATPLRNPLLARTGETTSPRASTPRASNIANRVSRAQPAAEQSGASIDSELLAAAPLSPDAYIPAQRSAEPQVVSPDMPLLPDAGEYLPEAPNRFNGYIWPARGTVTSQFGWRWGRMHNGVDVAGPVGTPVVAAAPGVIEQAGWNSGGFGNLVEIRHADGSMTRYAHNNSLNVSAGQTVAQGQQIAEMGSTGYSTGPHLHFEVHPDGGAAVNPVAFLPADLPNE
jgi:murein DD-endopeptidase MepM/ murein hydrolase activator NlpD